MTRNAPGLHSMTPVECAYAAGIIDGEGCIGLAFRRGRYICITVQISNTDRQLLEWFRERYGGSIYLARDNRPTRKAHYLWFVAARRARAVLTDALPYLIVKRPQAETVLAVPVRVVGARLTPEEITANLQAVAKVHALNKRGAA